MFYTTRPTLGHRQMTSSHVYSRGKAPKDLFIPDFLRSASHIERGFQKSGDGGPRRWTHEHGTATNRHCAEIRIVSQRFGSQSMTSFVFSIRWTIGCHLCIYRFLVQHTMKYWSHVYARISSGAALGQNAKGAKHAKKLTQNQSEPGRIRTIHTICRGSLASSIQYHTQMLL